MYVCMERAKFKAFAPIVCTDLLSILDARGSNSAANETGPLKGLGPGATFP